MENKKPLGKVKNNQLSKKAIPLIAVDTVVFTIVEGEFSVLLIQINSGHYEGKWAVPGGLVELKESLDSAAIRVLSEKANVKNIFLEQLYTFGNPSRDERGRVISVAYLALVGHPKTLKLKTLDYYRDIKWFPVRNLPEMAFDHEKIIKVAHSRVGSKLSYSNIAYSLLPEEFTLTQLQKVYEIVLGEKLDKRNFRKRMDSLDIVEGTGKIQKDVTHRPPKLYKFRERDLKFF